MKQQPEWTPAPGERYAHPQIGLRPTVCTDCGAVVNDDPTSQRIHDQWHDDLGGESAPAITPADRVEETAAWREILEMLPEGWAGSAAVDFLLEVLIQFPAAAVLEAARKVEE